MSLLNKQCNENITHIYYSDVSLQYIVIKLALHLEELKMFSCSTQCALYGVGNVQ